MPFLRFPFFSRRLKTPAPFVSGWADGSRLVVPSGGPPSHHPPPVPPLAAIYSLGMMGGGAVTSQTAGQPLWVRIIIK